MGNRNKIAYLDVLRVDYKKASHKEKQQLIDEALRVLKYRHRSTAIRNLNQPPQKAVSQKKTRRKKYSWQAQFHLRKLWLKLDQMCSKKMVSAFPKWLPSYTAAPDSVKKELLSMSAATIDRYLAGYRASQKRKARSGTKPGATYFKNRIPVKPLDRNIHSCGSVEADTVAHCGDSLSGVFAWSLTITDIKSGWTENTAMWGKSGKGVVEGIHLAQKNMPFPINEFFCDNGSEFLNHQLLHFFSNFSKPKKAEMIKRGRPYRKNDQCHVEQKNFTHVRQLFGYNRIDQKECIELMNDIYLNDWSKLQNFFVPQMKLVRKTRIGSKYKREYSKPMTPFERVLEEETIPSEVKLRLRKEFETLNPFELQDRIQKKTRRLFKMLEALSMKGAA